MMSFSESDESCDDGLMAELLSVDDPRPRVDINESDESWDDGLTAALLSVDDPRPHVDINELLCELLHDPQSPKPRAPKQAQKRAPKQAANQTPKPKVAKPAA